MQKQDFKTLRGLLVIQVSNSSGTVGRKAFPEKKNVVHAYVLLTLGINQSLVNTCLDCRMHEVTLRTHNREVFWLHIGDVRASIVMENEWSSNEQLRSVLVHFPAKFLLLWL